MASLFQGSPQTAFSTTKSSTETPEWMQKAIYDQIGWATNAAQAPYQPYSLPTVAELSPLQQQAYQQVQANQGSWQPGMNFAQSGMQDFASKGTADQLRGEQALPVASRGVELDWRGTALPWPVGSDHG